jgi:hypothetical protein
MGPALRHTRILFTEFARQKWCNPVAERPLLAYVLNQCGNDLLGACSRVLDVLDKATAMPRRIMDAN